MRYDSVTKYNYVGIQYWMILQLIKQFGIGPVLSSPGDTDQILSCLIYGPILRQTDAGLQTWILNLILSFYDLFNVLPRNTPSVHFLKF